MKGIRMQKPLSAIAFVLLIPGLDLAGAAESSFTATAREITDKGETLIKTIEKPYDPKRSAVIICDMWDGHWCKGAATRVAEMAGPMNEAVKNMLEERGVEPENVAFDDFG